MSESPQPKSEYIYKSVKKELPVPLIGGAAIYGEEEFRLSVTKNGYSVLTTPKMAIIDIDNNSVMTPKELEEYVIDYATYLAIECRIYRTANGLRVILMDKEYSGMTPELDTLMRNFGADPLYVMICTKQNTFRARLTPKPERMGLLRLHEYYNDSDAALDETKRLKYIDNFTSACKIYSTCRLLYSFINKESPLMDILNEHDAVALGQNELA